MISNIDQKTETFLRKRNESLSAISTSLRSIDRSLQRIAAMMEKNESMADNLTEELTNPHGKPDAGVKEENNDGRTSA